MLTKSHLPLIFILLISGGSLFQAFGPQSTLAQPSVSKVSTSVFYSHEANIVGQIGNAQFFSSASGSYAFNTNTSELTHIDCPNLIVSSNGNLFCLKGQEGNYDFQVLNPTTYSVLNSTKVTDVIATSYQDNLLFYGIPESLTQMAVYNLATNKYTFNNTVREDALENFIPIPTNSGILSVGTNPVTTNTSIEFYNTTSNTLVFSVLIDEPNLIGLEIFNQSTVAAAFFRFEDFQEQVFYRIVPVLVTPGQTTHGNIIQIPTLESVSLKRNNFFRFNDTHLAILSAANGYGTVGLYHFDASLNLVQSGNITVDYNYTFGVLRGAPGTNFAYLYVSNDNVKFLDYITIDLTVMKIVGGYMGNPPVLLNNGSLLHFGYSGILVSDAAHKYFNYTYLPVTDFFYDPFNDGIIWGFYLPETLVVPLNYTCYMVQVSIAQSSVGTVAFDNCPCPAPFDGKNYLQDVTLTEFGDLYVTYTCANLEVRILENTNTVYSFDTPLTAPVYLFPDYTSMEVNIVNIPDCKSTKDVIVSNWNYLTGSIINNTAVYFADYCDNLFEITKVSNDIMAVTNTSAKKSATDLALIDLTNGHIVDLVQLPGAVGGVDLILYNDPFAVEQFQVFVGHSDSNPNIVTVSDLSGKTTTVSFSSTPFVNHVSNTQFGVKLVLGDIGTFNIYQVSSP